MRDRFVCGLKNKAIKKKLLSEKKLTYQRAIELALSEETASRDTGVMDSWSTNGSINHNQIKGQRNGNNTNAERFGPCTHCGRNNHNKNRCEDTSACNSRVHSVLENTNGRCRRIWQKLNDLEKMTNDMKTNQEKIKDYLNEINDY
ncbi:uncharacterized protein LOC107046552 [Diachasma alloeum]|uniref:uncharacterized protein LOC107046552 n=1 Tax=Diachasma alloeum TaxID=454923 RepID=UPI0007382FC6|nr:uncharacterized protein LOC107046552 [Diachasma alloeum]